MVHYGNGNSRPMRSKKSDYSTILAATYVSVCIFVCFGRLFDLLLMYLAFLYLTVFEEI